MDLNILYEDSYLIVCEKPVGMPSQSDKTGDYDLVNCLKNYIFEKENAGAPYVGLIHRLDRPVGGIMVFAKQQYAAKVLSEQLRTKEMKKKYMAVVTQDLSDEIGTEKKLVVDYLVKEAKTNLSRISSGKDARAKKAELFYQVIDTKESGEIEYQVVSLLEIELLTGRHHQIRAQLSNKMTGLWGDTKYNSLFTQQKKWSNVALFAYYLEFLHPKTKKKLRFTLLPDKIPFDQFQEALMKYKV